MADRVPDPLEVAAAVRLSVGLLVRRLQQVPVEGELTLSERSALARLDRCGTSSASALARAEQVRPQSMGATIAELEARQLVVRRPDPADGRKVLIALTPAGQRTLTERRSASTAALARALAGLTAAEQQLLLRAAPLLERVADRL